MRADGKHHIYTSATGKRTQALQWITRELRERTTEHATSSVERIAASTDMQNKFTTDSAWLLNSVQLAPQDPPGRATPPGKPWAPPGTRCGPLEPRLSRLKPRHSLCARRCRLRRSCCCRTRLPGAPAPPAASPCNYCGSTQRHWQNIWNAITRNL